MRKIILELNSLMSREEVHSYLKEKFAFPEYYGKNLDALYDCLTDIGRPTAVGIFISETNHFAEETDVVLDNGCIGSEDSGIQLSESDDYIKKVIETFEDAERANDNLAVIIAH